MVVGVGQCKRLSVEGDAHDDLLGISTQSDPVVESVVGVEVSYFRLGMEVHGSNVSGFLIPMTVVVVSHDTDPVQIAGDGWYVVTGIDDRLGRRNGGRKQQSFRIESHTQFSDQGGEASLI